MMMIIFYDNDFANANAMKMKMKKIRMIMIKHLRWKDFSSTIIASSSKNKQWNEEKQKKKKKMVKKTSHWHSITSGKNAPLTRESIIGQEEK